MPWRAAARVGRPALTLPRRVVPELLDELPASDPRAVRARSDLRRVNFVLGSLPILLRALDACVRAAPLRLVELGAGDATLLLRIARSRHRSWPATEVELVDIEPVVGEATLHELRSLGWKVESTRADVLDWLDGAAPPSAGTVIFANLFVHHFDGERLLRLLGGVAAHAGAFVCCEPRRSMTALTGSRLLGLIGCNDVTRHDAVVSVHAGFTDRELSSLWTQACGADSAEWSLSESSAGAFSHLFSAIRLR